MLAAAHVCARAKPDVGRGVCACDARRPEKPEAFLKTTHAKAGEEKPASLASDRLGAGARGWGWLGYGIVIPYPG